MATKNYLIMVLACLLSILFSSCSPVIKKHQISDINQFSQEPQVSTVGAEDGRVYVVWNEDGQVNFRRGNMGASLSATMTPMTVGFNGQSFSPAPAMDVYGSRVYLAISGRDNSVSPNVEGVYFSRSTNFGESFSPTTNLSPINDTAGDVVVAGHGTNVSVAWVHKSKYPDPVFDTVYVSSSTDSGQTFTNPVLIGGPLTNNPYTDVLIDMYQDNVYVLWCQSNISAAIPSRIFLSRSTDAGATFQPPVVLVNNIHPTCGIIDFQVVNNNLYVAYSDNSAPNKVDVFFMGSTDAGVTFSSPQNVSNGNKRAIKAKLAVSGDHVYIAYRQTWVDAGGSESSDIYVAHSNNNGGSFIAPVSLRVFSTATDSEEPNISASGNYVHVAWSEYAGGSYDIYYAYSNNRGSTYNTPSKLPPGPSDALGEGEVVLNSRDRDIYAAWTRQIVGELKSEVFYYSKRQCPIMPSDPGSFRCLYCCN